MPKKAYLPPPPSARVAIQNDVSKSLAQASMNETQMSVYANHVQFSSNRTEVIIDLFFIGPDPLAPTKLKANYLQRVVIPGALAKGFVSAMAKTIPNLDESHEPKIDELKHKEEIKP